MGYFFDAATGGPLQLELRSIDGQKFSVLRRIGYHSDDYAEPFIVPDNLATFETDLASVPEVFLWLVPRSGVYAPAATLHDALTYTPTPHYNGPHVSREEADTIFRTAMQELGTGLVRSWIMWAAVAIGTLWLSRRWTTRTALVVTFTVIVGLGVLSTLDLFDVVTIFPWMGDQVWWKELIGGFIAAVIIPPVFAPTWGRKWRAELIASWTLALLLHVTAAVTLLYGAYLALERIASGPRDSRGVRHRHRTAVARGPHQGSGA